MKICETDIIDVDHRKDHRPFHNIQNGSKSTNTEIYLFCVRQADFK